LETLDNLGTDIEHDVASTFSSADMQLLSNDIIQDINAEWNSLAASAGAGVPPGKPNYIGGHFNLNILSSQVDAFSPSDLLAFDKAFMGTGRDGVRRAATTGLAASLHYTLHSQDNKIALGEFSFHFDRFNRNSVPFGTIGHGVWDWGVGSVGHPCLDPAWRQ
jgi:hypothetical protein